MTGDAPRVVLVWDGPTRLFHWLISPLMAAAYVTWRLNWMDWHAWTGDALLSLLIFRLLWGFFGSDTARFSRFLASPRTVKRYLATILSREPDRQAGHNPAGGWMVLLMLALLFGETLSGLYIDNDVADVGPLTDLTPAPIANAITQLHLLFWDALLVAATVHILAILFYARVKGHNLVLPMLTGKKNLPENVPQPRIGAPARAVFCFVLSGIATAALVNFL